MLVVYSIAALFVAIAALLPSAASAASAKSGDSSVSVELNKLEPNGTACRAYLLLKNDAGTAFESLKLDLVMFDRDGVVAKRVAVETAPLAARKTSLKVFDIPGQSCDGIGRILLNDIQACEAKSGPRPDCLELVAPSARGDVPFIK